MQTLEEVDYYLHRDFYGEYSRRCCIYARESCDVFMPSDGRLVVVAKRIS